MKIRILVVDDHEIVRYGLRCLLLEQPDMVVIGEAENGRIAVELAKKLKPNVVIMDIAMPIMNGFEAARQIRSKMPEIKIVALSMYQNRRFIVEMLQCGASGYILKSNIHDDLVRAISAAVSNEVYLSSKITGVVTGEYVKSISMPNQSLRPVLSPRERETLQLISEGRSTKEIALQLNVSIKTIESNRRQIMQKLSLHNVADLTKYAIAEGMTSIEF